MSECPIAARLPTGRTLPAGAGNLVLQFRVKGSAAPDESADPRTQRFYALPDTTRAPAVTRHFRFEQGNGQWQINGRLMDSACGDVRLRIRQNSAEHWVFDNNSTTWCTKTTLKPELDSVAVLGRYARRFQTGAGWSFLTGDPRDLELCRRRLGFTNPDPVRDADKLNHTGMVRFGNEPLTLWSACPGLGSAASLAHSILSVDWYGRRSGTAPAAACPPPAPGKSGG